MGTILNGVPQSSIQGPILFDVFLNDISIFINQWVIYNYADENTLLFINANTDVLKKVLSVTPNINELFQHNLINVSYLTACYLYQVMMTLHFLNDVANDAESTQKSRITSNC